MCAIYNRFKKDQGNTFRGQTASNSYCTGIVIIIAYGAYACTADFIFISVAQVMRENSSASLLSIQISLLYFPSAIKQIPHILTKNNHNAIIFTTGVMSMQEHKIKHVMQWHITHRCNLRCSHCYQDEYSSELSFGELERLLYQYLRFCEKNAFHGHINFTGGEPLLSGHLFPLMELCDKNKLTFGLLTNGTMINDEIADRLSLFRGLSFVQVSIDGTEQTHDSVRGKGNFRRVLNGLRLAGDRGIQTMAAFTCHKRNYKELKDVIRIVRRNKTDRFWADRLVPMGSSNEDALSDEEYREVIEILTAEHSRKHLFSHTDVHLNRSLQFLGGGSCYYQCAAGKTLLTLLADGTLLPCRRLPIPIGNCLADDMTELCEKSELIRELQEQRIPEECLPCPHAVLCRGGAKCLTYAMTGDYRGKDVNCYYKY